VTNLESPLTAGALNRQLGMALFGLVPPC
jgi:hypothetical protein